LNASSVNPPEHVASRHSGEKTSKRNTTGRMPGIPQ
jgi:hypothetical protein